MPRAQVVRIPEELDKRIEDAASRSKGTVEGFLIFCALFYLELVDGGFIMAHTREKHLEFIRLAAKGMSLRSIGSAIGVSHGTICGWKRKYAGRISEMCSGDMDIVLKAWAEAKNQRIAKVAERIRQVEEELVTRDLTKVSTSSLMRLHLAYRSELRAEVQPVEINVQVDQTTANYMAILAECGVMTE